MSSFALVVASVQPYCGLDVAGSGFVEQFTAAPAVLAAEVAGTAVWSACCWSQSVVDTYRVSGFRAIMVSVFEEERRCQIAKKCTDDLIGEEVLTVEQRATSEPGASLK